MGFAGMGEVWNSEIRIGRCVAVRHGNVSSATVRLVMPGVATTGRVAQAEQRYGRQGEGRMVRSGAHWSAEAGEVRRGGSRLGGDCQVLVRLELIDVARHGGVRCGLVWQAWG